MCLLFREEQGELCTSGPDKGKGLAPLPGGGWTGVILLCVYAIAADIPLTKASTHPDLRLSKPFLRVPFSRLHNFPGGYVEAATVLSNLWRETTG